VKSSKTKFCEEVEFEFSITSLPLDGQSLGSWGSPQIFSKLFKQIIIYLNIMAEASYKVEEVIFEKCPICGTGKVQKLKSTGFLSFAKSDKIICAKCNAKFIEKGEREGERVFKLDISESNQENQYDGEALKVSEWERGISDLDFCIQTNTLPKADGMGLKIILKPGEEAHWHSPTQLMEERAIRHTYGGAVRVMKGVYIGGRKGESHGELRTIDTGSLLLTNKRLIFNGGFRNSEYKLDKVVSVEEYKDAIEIGASNRKKVQIFVVDEPHKWATYIRIAVQNYHGGSRGKKK